MEFDRMCQGYHRRAEARWHHTRLLAATLYNVNRGPDAEYLRPEDFLPLPGDALAPAVPLLSEAEYREAQARLDELDKDLL